jgi:hypothetical protein
VRGTCACLRTLSCRRAGGVGVLRRGVWVCLAGVCILAIWTTAARAGTYDVWSCELNDGTHIGIDGWTPYNPFNGAATNTCGTPDGGLMAGLDKSVTMGGGAAMGWLFSAPPNVSIDNYTLYRYARAVTVDFQRSRDYWLYYDVPLAFNPLAESPHEACVAHAPSTCSEVGVRSPAFASVNRSEAEHRDIKRLYLLSVCDGGSAGCPPVIPAAYVVLFSSRIGLADLHPPAFRSPPTGSLLDGSSVLDGERSVRFEGADLGGGLESVTVVVDGLLRDPQPINGSDARCRRPFTNVVPCPLVADGTLVFDTAQLSNGAHSVQVALIDAAGNRTLSDPIAIETRNGGRPNGVGATRSARMRTWFRAGGRERTTRTVSYGRRSSLRGVLTSTDGRPIGHATIEVSFEPRRLGAREHRLPAVETDARGRFRLTAGAGPSRELRFGYRAFALDDAPAVTSEATLNVRAGVRLRIRPHRVAPRAQIVFSGRLLGGPGQRDTQVGLFAVARKGRDRVPVATLRADRRGRFDFRYRFRRTFAPFTYYFQAVVQRQNGYPYATGRSRRVSVRIVR